LGLEQVWVPPPAKKRQQVNQRADLAPSAVPLSTLPFGHTSYEVVKVVESSPSRPGPKRRWLRLLAFLIALVPCLVAANRAGVWLSDRVSSDPADESVAVKAPLIIVPESSDFGTSWETDAFAWNVVFKNVSDGPVTLGDMRGACVCTKVVWEKDATLKPGEWVAVPLVIDLLQLRTYDPAELRSVEVQILAKVGRKGAGLPRCHLGLLSNRRWVDTCPPFLHLSRGGGGFFGPRCALR
jgi:hypothetical protein